MMFVVAGAAGMAAAASLGFPFTHAQWNELQRQAMIYKYMMASIPVPSDLLFPLSSSTPCNYYSFHFLSLNFTSLSSTIQEMKVHVINLGFLCRVWWFEPEILRESRSRTREV